LIADAIQVAGALAILIPYVLGLAGRLDSRSYTYLLLNLGGSATLTVLAALQPSWGFVLLGGAWSLISAWALIELRVSPESRADRPSVR
jgi:hypothetical protein